MPKNYFLAKHLLIFCAIERFWRLSAYFFSAMLEPIAVATNSKPIEPTNHSGGSTWYNLISMTMLSTKIAQCAPCSK